MNQLEIIARQRELLTQFWEAEASRSEAEQRAMEQRQVQQSTAATSGATWQEEAQKLASEAQGLKDEVLRLVSELPPVSLVPRRSADYPLQELRKSVKLMAESEQGLRRTVVALEELGEARTRVQRILRWVVIGILLIAVGWTALAKQQQQARVPVQATARVQAQVASEALGREVSPLAFEGVRHNADWSPLITEFDGVPMALVPADCFRMGSREGEENERPVHLACFTAPFWIDVTEVTNAQFTRLGGFASLGSAYVNPQQPRVRITWDDASVFCQRRGMRLANEAEWEYAARGPDNLAYPWGRAFVADSAVFQGNSGGHSWDVGSKPGRASWVGALDMSGNMWEYVADWYDATHHVVRGGSWNELQSALRCAVRRPSSALPHDMLGKPGILGFRCAASILPSGP